MASEKKTFVKRSSSNTSLSPIPPEKRRAVPGTDENTSTALDIQPRPSTRPERRRNMIPTPPKRRSIPCIGCIELMSDSQLACCYDGYSPDACARCAVRKQECLQPTGANHIISLFKDLHNRYYEGNYDPEPQKDQRVAQGYIHHRKIRKSLIRGLKHGVESILEIVGGSAALQFDELACFREAVKGMASLLIDEPDKEVVARRVSVSLGAETALEIVNAKEHRFHMNGFRKGAEAVASLLPDRWESDWRMKPKVLEGFIQGAEIIIESIPDAQKERSPVL